MSADHTITWVGDKTKPWSSQKGGAMIDYTIAVDGREGTLKLTQKPETAVPVPGDTLYGHIESEDITPKNGGETFTVHRFRKDQREDGPQRVSATSTARKAGVDFNEFDARGARIERMAAHKAAATLTAGKVPPHGGDFDAWLAALSEDLDSYEQARGLKASAPPRNAAEGGSAPKTETVAEISEAEAVAELAAQGVSDSDDIPF